jgi:hypothetical protein
MRVRLLVTASVLTLLMAACTGSTTPTGTPTERPLSAETLLLGTPDGPLVMRVPEGSIVFDGAGAVSSLGGAWVLSTSFDHGRTAVEARDAATGEVRSASSVPGELEARIVSESGRAVALTEPLPGGWNPALPFPQARTRIVVADPTGERETITLDLQGNFEPEAFSTDDEKLFLIQHMPAETPTAYRVTMLDLSRGSLNDVGPDKVRPVFGPFKGPAERMPGTRLSQLLAPDADQLYTLYTSARPGYAPHGAPVANDANVSFVHVLSLEDGWAHCVGLPRAMWDRPADAQAMATTPDGSYLYVVDAGRGLVAAMHTESLKVRTSPIDLPAMGSIGRTSAWISPDGRTLFVSVAGDDSADAAAGDDGSTVTAFDASTFEVLDSWRLGGVVSSIGVSSDGSNVYAAVEDRLAVLDAASGSEVAAVPLPSAEPVVRVLPLAA